MFSFVYYLQRSSSYVAMFVNNSIHIPSKALKQGYRFFKYTTNKVIRIRKRNNSIDDEIKSSNTPEGEKNNLEDDSNLDKNIRYNEINLQMLPGKIYKQVFGDLSVKSLNKNETEEVQKELKKFGCDVSNKSPEIPDMDLILPPLEGQNLEEHFKNIANNQVQLYIHAIETLLDTIPPMPKNFLLKEGWTRYTDSSAESIDFPIEDGLIFDVEVCMKEGQFPTLATAVSQNAWYCWVSKSLAQGSSNFPGCHSNSLDKLIPMESYDDDRGNKLNKHQKKPKIVVGHNVGYDRIRIKEQYWQNCTNTRFLDTLSMHVCVSGTSSYQRAVLKSKNLNFDDEKLYSLCSLNNLRDVYKLYCDKELDKSNRDIFVEGTLKDIRDNFNQLVTYCASDVVATQMILKQLFPLFNQRFPHPATLAGMLELGSAYLPVNDNWSRYVKESETIFDDLNLETKVCLARRADRVCRLSIEKKYEKDPWMWDQDWSIKDLKIRRKIPKDDEVSYDNNVKVEKETKENIKCNDISKSENEEEESEHDKLKHKFQYLDKTKLLLPKKLTHMPCYPNWYRKLCYRSDEVNDSWLTGAQNISTSMSITPKLLNLTWENYPLHYIRNHGWGFLIPYTNVDNIQSFSEIINEAGRVIVLNDNLEKQIHSTGYISDKLGKVGEVNGSSENNCFLFIKLPHKDGEGLNVGNPLSKDFINKFSENVLTGNDTAATRILQISNMTSYWKNNRDRILSQLVIWLNEENRNQKRMNKVGAILPLVITAGTLTRRAVEPTWMTASKAHPERIGSELRAMIQAPPNYCIVGADVDSQELWLASIIGDSFSKKIQGSTPFSWMTLIGNKAAGTDMHSITAKSIGISRDQAKIINYARIYGAGKRFAERLLKQFNPTMSDRDCATKSQKMFQLTKGKKLYQLKSYFLCEELEDKLYSQSEALRIAKLYNKPLNYVFEKGKWYGGSESAMFNSLEEIISKNHPTTPFLDARLSRALEHEADYKNLPTKVNWVVQSGAVDFLHLILVCMRWLMKDKARFCLSFHDEVRYLVPIKYKYNVALAMHVTNLLVRSYCVSRLGMRDLPMSVAFFNSVEVDTALRKEADHNYITPSNPHGLDIGYGIKAGESLNIWEAIEKSNGQVGVLSIKKAETQICDNEICIKNSDDQ